MNVHTHICYINYKEISQETKEKLYARVSYTPGAKRLTIQPDVQAVNFSPHKAYATQLVITNF